MRLQVRAHALQMLNRKSKSLKDVIDVLKVYRDNVGEEAVQQLGEDEEPSPPQKEILGALIEFLEGCL